MGTDPGPTASAASSFPLSATNPSSEATKKSSIGVQAANNAKSSRRPLPRQVSTVKAADVRARFREDVHGHHEHTIHSYANRGKSFKMVRHFKEQQIRHVASNWLKRLRKETADPTVAQNMSDPAQVFASKYSKCGDVLGWGAFGTVRVCYKIDEKNPRSKQVFAVKEHKQLEGESDDKYHKRVVSEVCISSSLHHQNILATLDLLQDDKGMECQIMEYFPGEDLHSVILHAGALEETEADCFFKQLIQGLVYMHEMGVAHRDLKPENVLLTTTGLVKIIDFGNAECFRTAWETEPRMSAGICGSLPYTAPEEFTLKEFDPRPLDVWACGIIYMAMRTGEHPWRAARPDEDVKYQQYVERRKTEAGYEPIECLRRRQCRNVVYSILEPTPIRRLTAHQVRSSEWVQQIPLCCADTADD
ncbi:hypothetical protein COCMIDRAFT_7498 [Bipolaris oryzae ATCC 44560]|uniref:non-specific serine/threonine protein kinase n=1 Tax=Bipolaris oryzae ATCC 44560 TaxID=930090 RepID=W6YU91_COCMI|nr:uncharacterized protein COCMIDRAFT_7498 [Bipolaris oryzae ATCC 44560]EUC43027.1 hypothetical protein COCMIDRAFT_7498 [Bipolaris oryzae ATCC 44560]